MEERSTLAETIRALAGALDKMPRRCDGDILRDNETCAACGGRGQHKDDCSAVKLRRGVMRLIAKLDFLNKKATP